MANDLHTQPHLSKGAAALRLAVGPVGSLGFCRTGARGLVFLRESYGTLALVFGISAELFGFLFVWGGFCLFVCFKLLFFYFLIGTFPQFLVCAKN